MTEKKTKPAVYSFNKDQSVSTDLLTGDGAASVYFNFASSRGFGQLSFFQEGDKFICSDELMGLETAIHYISNWVLSNPKDKGLQVSFAKLVDNKQIVDAKAVAAISSYLFNQKLSYAKVRREGIDKKNPQNVQAFNNYYVTDLVLENDYPNIEVVDGKKVLSAVFKLPDSENHDFYKVEIDLEALNGLVFKDFRVFYEKLVDVDLQNVIAQFLEDEEGSFEHWSTISSIVSRVLSDVWREQNNVNLEDVVISLEKASVSYSNLQPKHVSVEDVKDFVVNFKSVSGTSLAMKVFDGKHLHEVHLKRNLYYGGEKVLHTWFVDTGDYDIVLKAFAKIFTQLSLDHDED